jgi:post-segregation antitoxin (ccd killing protein)
MRIYVDNNSVYLTSSNQIDTLVSMSTGGHNVVIQAWDSSGAVFKASETITVTTSSATVTVSSPANNATVSSPFQVVASASGPNPITAMQIYLDNQLVTSLAGASLNVPVNAATGTHSLVVQAWDSTGATYKNLETVTVSTTSSATVTVSSPANNATVSSPFQVVASASGPNPITAMQVYLDSQLVTTVQSGSLNASVSAATGAHSLVVQAWDSTGAVYKNALTVSVSGSSIPSNAIVKSDIEDMTGWESCTTCAGAGGTGPTAGFSVTQFQSSPSEDGSSAQFSIWGTTPYSDALWWKQLGADNSASNFEYDVDFYLTTPQYAQALEFDVNQSNGVTKFIFGTQCNIKNGAVWDVWDTAGAKWVHTAVPCAAPSANTWHHLTWELKRSSTQATFIAVTLDGVRSTVNMTFNAKPVTANELNVAFQLDGDYAQHAYSAWLDNVTLTYW